MFRLLKKLQLRGVEKLKNEPCFVASMTSFDANKADGLFQHPAKPRTMDTQSKYRKSIRRTLRRT